MSVHGIPGYLNTQCRPYPVVFSPEKNAKSIQKYSFPVVKRSSAEKCHETSAWLQKGSQCSVIHNGELPAIVENRSHLTKEQVGYYTTPEGIVDLNKKGISIAVDKRVALFFQQAILCYGMSGFTFSARGADDQIGTSPGMKFASSKSSFTMHKREAAHSSTVPTLIAHAKDGSTPNGFVFLKGGSSYYQHNATIGMHECVNGADELIDGKGQDHKLRDTAVKILNRVAQGLDPVQATKEFCRSFDKEVLSTSARLKQDDKRRFVLERYHEKIKKIQQAATDSVLFDRLIGVSVNPENPNEHVLREAVYKKRYDVIRLQEIVESRIGKRIADVKEKMDSHDRFLLEHMLLSTFSTTSERKILEKLFGKTVAFFENEIQPVPSALKGFRTQVQNLNQKYLKELDVLRRDLRSDFRKLSSAEYSYRAGVFKDLRTKVNHWTQEEFRENYRQTTGASVSQAWVSRMEQLSHLPKKNPGEYATPITQRRRYVTLEDAKRCAATFGVDAGIFLPSLFTSS